MNIAILDDDKFFCEHLFDSIKKHLKQIKVQASIEMFNYSSDFLNSNENFDLLFLDVSMPDISGMEVSKILIEENKDICIVFLTSHPQYIGEAFKARAFRYIIKPIESHEINDLLNDFIYNYPDNICLFFDSKGVNHIIKHNHILYIESVGDNTTIFTMDKIYESKLTLKQWSEKLDSKFFYQSYKTHILNLKHVLNFEDEIMMDNNKVIPLSKRRKKDFHDCMKRLFDLRN